VLHTKLKKFGIIMLSISKEQTMSKANEYAKLL